MLWNYLQAPPSVQLLFLFSNQGVNISKFVQNGIRKEEGLVLVIDNKHIWRGTGMPTSVKILQPNTKSELLEQVSSLPLFINPQLKYIVVDYLPLFFRDSSGSFSNTKEYALCLALLKKISSTIKVLITSYASGIDPHSPVLPEVTKYYMPTMYYLISSNPYQFEVI